jgi:hypothetical protein
MKAEIGRWAKVLERRVLQERNGAKLSKVLRAGEFINVLGIDSSILEVVLEDTSYYTRVVWSIGHPLDQPFALYEYYTERYADFPKTEFHLQPHRSRFCTAHRVEQVLFAE